MRKSFCIGKIVDVQNKVADRSHRTFQIDPPATSLDCLLGNPYTHISRDNTFDHERSLSFLPKMAFVAAKQLFKHLNSGWT